MSLLVSCAPPDRPWAQWIADSLQVAGHAVDLAPTRNDFAPRIVAALSGPDPVIILHSAELAVSTSDWRRIRAAAGKLIVFRLDETGVPGGLSGVGCPSLCGLGEEEALEVLLGAVGWGRRAAA
ncbi:toll/interleukin-1 receptor domain-containing protein [Actinoplanes sp. NPDC051851]|uniref:toll/interleukin-1 receptor domain-containing protein n=1 Tax=Actinoplanes sp. NPDC051851 TaxID=3154753 RepID=UPI003424864A